MSHTRPVTLAVLFFMVISPLPLTSYATGTGRGDAVEQARSSTAEVSANHIQKAADYIKADLKKEAVKVLLEIVKEAGPDKNMALLMLGRLYKEEGSFDKAEECLIKAAADHPLLRDYALKLLSDIYLSAEKYDRVIETVRRIDNRLLMQYAKQSEISSLLSLKREDEAAQALSLYAKKYPDDWKAKFVLAALLKKRGAVEQAVRLFREIYIKAVPESHDARRELGLLKADVFTKDELLSRADNLYKNNNFSRAESTYREVLGLVNEDEKARVIFSVGMSQFMQKNYSRSAKSFGKAGTPKALYWKARSYYRKSDTEGFSHTLGEFENKYPGDRNLALLYLMEADEMSRKGQFGSASKNYTRVLERFRGNEEEALWGLGWLNYSSGNYRAAFESFSKLSKYDRSRDYYKYLYWMARSSEKMASECVRMSAADGSENSVGGCDDIKKDIFSTLPSDESFYGYLIKFRSASPDMPDKVVTPTPEKPAGEVYDRIEALSLIGMRDEAVSELLDAAKNTADYDKLTYLGHVAMKLEEYKAAIAFAAPMSDRRFLPYAYPLGYWDTVTEAARSRNLDAYLLAALIREESRFDPEVVSWAGAIGLMQMMPHTARRLKNEAGVSLSDGSQLKDAKKNILLGSYYLSKLVEEFREVPLAIAAYNAGEMRLRQWTEQYLKDDMIEFIENIPYTETKNYVKRVLKSYWRYRTINGLSVDHDNFFCNPDCFNRAPVDDKMAGNDTPPGSP